MNKVTFDGHDLSTLFTVGSIRRDIASPSPTYENVPGRDGAVFKSTVLGTMNVEVDLYLIGGTEKSRRQSARTLASWLAVDEPGRLEIDEDDGLYYMAVPSGAVSVTRFVKASSMTVVFTILHPAAYGESKSATVPSGGSVTFQVGGSYPTQPTISAASAVRSSSSLVWGVRLDNGDFIHVPTGASTGVKLVVDCDKRTAKRTASSISVLPTLDSDWLVLSPGQHTLRNDQGSGACTVTWIERWA